MKRFIVLSMLISLLWGGIQSDLYGKVVSGEEIRYVMAPSGLNLRQSSDPASAKLTKVPYGEALSLLSPAASRNMLVDNLKGGMAKVKYKGQTGYIFDGYLSRFPAPLEEAHTEKELEKYVDQIRGKGMDVMLEIVRRDYGGYFQSQHGIYLRSDDFQECFLIAKQLYGIPPKLILPKPGDKEGVMINPDKQEHYWSDELVCKRNGAGEITEIYYYLRAEGGGSSIVIERDEKNEAEIRIAETFIAD